MRANMKLAAGQKDFYNQSNVFPDSTKHIWDDFARFLAFFEGNSRAHVLKVFRLVRLRLLHSSEYFCLYVTKSAHMHAQSAMHCSSWATAACRLYNSVGGLVFWREPMEIDGRIQICPKSWLWRLCVCTSVCDIHTYKQKHTLKIIQNII